MDDLEDLARRQARAQNGLDPSHARPQPWFVGSGKGLMLLVVTLVAVLIGLRGVTTVWLAQDAWRWWLHGKPRMVAPAPVLLPPSPIAAPPAAIALPSRPATAKGSPAAWFGADAYPAEAIRNEEEGRTVSRILIGRDGRVRSCGIVTSSGHPRLDAATCDILVRRGAFEPARDAAGRAIEATRQIPVRWVLPHD